MAGIGASGASLSSTTVHRDRAIDSLVLGGQDRFFVAQADHDTSDPAGTGVVTPI